MQNYQEHFNKLTTALKALGYKGEVLINEQGLFLTACDDFSKQVIRVVCKRNKGLVSYFPKKSSYAFMAWLPELDNKKALKELKMLTA